MIELGLVYLQLLLLVSRYQRRNAVSILLCLYTVSVLPTEVVADRSAFIKVERSEASEVTGRTPMFGEGTDDMSLKLLGSFARAGTVKGAGGLLHKVPHLEGADGAEMEESLRSLSLEQDWIAVLEVPAGSSNTGSNPSIGQSVLDRVRKVMLFGASAIIILAMNPKMVTELDISQLFPRPVVLIQEVENVTALLSALASKIKMKVRLTYNTSYYDIHKITTLTLWATCGRSSGIRSYSEFDGVICLGDPNDDVSKADPALLWSYFFSGMSFLLFLFMIKAKRGARDRREGSQPTQSLQRLMHEAIRGMKVRRYKQESRKHDDSDRDTCAVCLDAFCNKQKIRVMPCFHEFHVGCVDPWLKLHHTCPLCKLNIIDQQIKLGAQ